MPLEPLQLRDVDPPRSVVLVRQGARTLNDERLAQSCEMTRARWGIFGFSVHELPAGGYEELARLAPILRRRPRVLEANATELVGNGFPLLPSGIFPHWTVVLAEPTAEQFRRVRSCFRERANPIFDSGGG